MPPATGRLWLGHSVSSVAGDHERADHAVRLVARQVADVEIRARACRTGPSSRGVEPAGIDTSVGRDPWTGSVPVRWRAWTAASPTIHSWSIGSSLRSTTVIGGARPDRDPRRRVVRVVDRRSRSVAGPCPGACVHAAAMPARPSERAMPPTRARRPGRRCPVIVAVRSGHRQRRSPSAIRTRPPIPPIVNARPTTSGMRAAVRSGGDDAPGRSSPAMTRDGAPAPDASIARSKRQIRRRGVDGHLGQPARGRDPAHALCRRAGRRGARPWPARCGPRSSPLSPVGAGRRAGRWSVSR